VPQLRESSTESWLSTNANGIINLADAATPSLSNNLADNCEDSVSNAYVESETEAEDMRMLREVEEIERAEQSKRQCKGKRKLFQSDEDADEDSYTDGFNESSADGDDRLWEYEGWSHLMTSEFPTGVSDNDMETGHLSDESQHDDAAREESLTPATNISEAVLAFHQPEPSPPLSPLDRNDNYGSDLAFSDAEPVFDDVYNLTFVDGCAPASSEEDAIYIGRMFKDKEHMRTTLSIYAIKRLFHFKQTRSDPGRLIFVFVDRRCRWRVYAVSAGLCCRWYAKEAAIMRCRGSDEDSYKLLAVYMHSLQQANPGTRYKLEYTEAVAGSKQFKYLFFAIGACVAGMKYMRRVVLIDGTAIKDKFKGVLLTVSMQDANFMVFPIAFGIVDSESEPAWSWFLRQLTTILPDAADVVIVSDRHRSIYAAMGQVYLEAFHGACAVHIERNVRLKFPKKGVSNLVSKAARAFNETNYGGLYKEIERRSPGCSAYLDAIPKPHWTQAYCDAKRYNLMSSNIAESLNSALAKIIELPIVTMVEAIRTKLMK